MRKVRIQLALLAPLPSHRPDPPAGAILPNSTRDVLLIGSPNTLQCYDIERNR
jgi:hypothetical protein